MTDMGSTDPDELIQLYLNGGRIAVLGILDQETIKKAKITVPALTWLSLPHVVRRARSGPLPRLPGAHEARQDAPAPGRLAGDPGVLLLALQAGRNEGAGAGSVGAFKSLAASIRTIQGRLAAPL